MVFINIATLIVLTAFLASAYQYVVLQTNVKPKWIYRLHYAAMFSLAYLVIQIYNAAVFLTFATIVMLVTKAYDMTRDSKREIALITETSRDIWLFLLIFWFVRTTIYDYSPVPSGSMEPTFFAGDLIAVNKMAYQVKIPPMSKPLYTFAKPKKGDIVIFTSPINPNEYWIKRVIATAGDHVVYKNKQYIINGEPYQQSNHSLHPEKNWLSQADETIADLTHRIQLDNRQYNKPLDIIVPENSYFVSGDNRDFSMDSRIFGPIHQNSIVGKATHIIAHFSLPSIVSFHRSGSVQ